MISKMNPEGSRLGVVFSGSPLFTGDAGSGESEIRRWIIENDLLECIVQLPDRMFFNTGIVTYIWIITNRKENKRKNKIQLIDISEFYDNLKQNLGEKKKYITTSQINKVSKIYTNFEENENSKIYQNDYFGYKKIETYKPLLKDGKLSKGNNGEIKPDKSSKDTEKIPINEDIEQFSDKHLKPYVEDIIVDLKSVKIGYEINFNNEFYKFTPLRSLEEIKDDILKINEEIDQLNLEIDKL